LEATPDAGPEKLADFVRGRFEREFKNERRVLNFLSGQARPEPSAGPATPAANRAPDHVPQIDLNPMPQHAPPPDPSPADATQEYGHPDDQGTPTGEELPRDVTVIFGTVNPLPSETGHSAEVHPDNVIVEMEPPPSAIIPPLDLSPPPPPELPPEPPVEWVDLSVEFSIEQVPDEPPPPPREEVTEPRARMPQPLDRRPPSAGQADPVPAPVAAAPAVSAVSAPASRPLPGPVAAPALPERDPFEYVMGEEPVVVVKPKRRRPEFEHSEVTVPRFAIRLLDPDPEPVTNRETTDPPKKVNR